MEPKVFWWNLAQINACTGLFYQVQKKKLKNSISEALSVDEGTYSIPSLTKVKLQTDFQSELLLGAYFEVPIAVVCVQMMRTY